MKVPFGAITLTKTARELINISLDKNRLTSGKNVERLEKMFAEYIGTKYAVAVSSGTDALQVALSALNDYGILPGREIAVPALTFIATANAVVHAGFEPMFVDIEKETLNMNPKLLKQKMSREVGGLLPVHLIGKPANMAKLMEIAATWNIPIIEDAAEAHGGSLGDKKLGSIGIAGCFSMYAAHIFCAIEGGMITTNDEQFAHACISLRNHGTACDCTVCVNTSQGGCTKRFANGYDRRFVFDRIGYSAKMNEIEAAVGIGSMEIADQIIEKRRENFYMLEAGLEKFDEFYTIHEGKDEKIGPHAFPIIFRVGQGSIKLRDEFGAFLSREGIDSRTLFQSIPTQSKAFGRYNFKGESYPDAEYVADNGLHVGIHQDMGKAECEYVISAIEKFLTK